MSIIVCIKLKRIFYLYERKLFWPAYYKVGAFDKQYFPYSI